MGFIPQTVTAHFKNTAYDNTYISRQFSTDGTSGMFNFALEENGILSCYEKLNAEGSYYHTYYMKLFPPYNHAQLISNESDNLQESIKGEGSGFLLTESGLVVSNYHVIEDANSIEIVFPLYINVS